MNFKVLSAFLFALGLSSNGWSTTITCKPVSDTGTFPTFTVTPETSDPSDPNTKYQFNTSDAIVVSEVDFNMSCNIPKGSYEVSLANEVGMRRFERDVTDQFTGQPAGTKVILSIELPPLRLLGTTTGSVYFENVRPDDEPVDVGYTLMNCEEND